MKFALPYKLFSASVLVSLSLAACVHRTDQSKSYRYVATSAARESVESARRFCDYDAEKAAIAAADDDQSAVVTQFHKEGLFVRCMRAKGFDRIVE